LVEGPANASKVRAAACVCVKACRRNKRGTRGCLIAEYFAPRPSAANFFSGLPRPALTAFP